MLKQEPVKKVIIYRSQAQQMQDEYLWGDGLFSPLGITDILIVVSIIGAAIVLFSKMRRRVF